MPRWSAGRRWGLVTGSLVVLVAAAAVAIYAGLYNIAADVPHTQPVYWLLDTLRERSVAVRARDIVFRRIWMIQPAYQRVRANMRRCAAVVILLQE
jgi:hypothetical protein